MPAKSPSIAQSLRLLLAASAWPLPRRWTQRWQWGAAVCCPGSICWRFKQLQQYDNLASESHSHWHCRNASTHARTWVNTSCGGWAKGHLHVASTRAYPQSLSTVTPQKKQVRPAVTLPSRSADAAAPILRLLSMSLRCQEESQQKRKLAQLGDKVLNGSACPRQSRRSAALKAAHGGRRDRRGETRRNGQ